MPTHTHTHTQTYTHTHTHANIHTHTHTRAAVTDLVAAGQSNMAKASLLVSNGTRARELTKLKAIAVCIEQTERRDVRGG